jgi:hypothetical protein
MLRASGLGIVAVFCLLLSAGDVLATISGASAGSYGLDSTLALLFGTVGIGLTFLSASAMLLARSVLRQFDPWPVPRAPAIPRSYR